MREIFFRGKRTDNGEWVERLPYSELITKKDDNTLLFKKEGKE